MFLSQNFQELFLEKLSMLFIIFVKLLSYVMFRYCPCGDWTDILRMIKLEYFKPVTVHDGEIMDHNKVKTPRSKFGIIHQHLKRALP